MIRNAFTFASLAAALAGCTVGPDYARPEAPVSNAVDSGAFLRSDGTGGEVAVPVARWWEALGDPVLTRLVEQGLSDSPGLAVAAARVRQARAGVSSARAALLPVLSASGTYVYADLPNAAFGTGGGTEFFSLGFDAQWEADLWGGKGREVEAALAKAGVAEAQQADAMVSLSAEIARTYTSLQARRAASRLLQERQAYEQRIVSLSGLRLKAGTGTGQELSANRSRLAGTRAEFAAVEAEVTVLLDALAVLTGLAPGELEPIAVAAIPLPPEAVPIGDPAAMLARRPDVIAADREYAAATASVGAARAARFPGVSLMGLVGLGGESIGDVFDSSQLSALAIPRLTWNFLDFGRAGAAVRGAEAGRDAALAQYRQSVLAALQDAEGSLARFGAARIAFRQGEEASGHAAEIARLQQLRADAGAISELDALAARRDAIDARLAETNSKASLTLSYITLAKSLGLGWQADTSKPQEAKSIK